jgi:hypothetical protein
MKFGIIDCPHCGDETPGLGAFCISCGDSLAWWTMFLIFVPHRVRVWIFQSGRKHEGGKHQC